jgi:hypothetical protein
LAKHFWQLILGGRGQQARVSSVLRPPLRSTCGRHSPRQGIYTLASLLGTRPAWLPGFLVHRCRDVSWAGQTTAQLAAGFRARSTSVAQPIVETEPITCGFPGARLRSRIRGLKSLATLMSSPAQFLTLRLCSRSNCPPPRPFHRAYPSANGPV